MKLNNKYKNISTIIIASTLFACGGGSGNSKEGVGTPDEIASKYTDRTSFAELNENNAAEFVSDIYVKSKAFLNNDAFENGEIIIPGLPISLEQLPSTSQNCYSGSLISENNLNNGLGSLSITLNKCHIEHESTSYTLDGSLSIQFNSLDSSNTPHTYSIAFNNLKFTTEDSVNNLSSSFFMHGINKVESDGVNRKYTSNLVNKVTSTDSENTSYMTQIFTITESSNTNGIKEYNISGDYYDGTKGKVTISTTKPLTIDYSGLYTGEFTLHGENNSNAKLVADNYSFSLYVDSDDDGIYEYVDEDYTL